MAAITLPPQLARRGYRLIKLGNRGERLKYPLELGWNIFDLEELKTYIEKKQVQWDEAETSGKHENQRAENKYVPKRPAFRGRLNNYEYDDPEFVDWLKRGNNYGVTGAGGLIKLESDDVARWHELGAMDLLPDSFTVQSSSPNRQHFYYDGPETSDAPLKDPETGEDIGHIRGTGEAGGRGGQVVGPGSLHPHNVRYQVIRDLPIAKIDKETLDKITAIFASRDTGKSSKTSSPKADLKDPFADVTISQVLGANYHMFNMEGSQMAGPNPYGNHTNQNGRCLVIEPDDKAFYCFECEQGGGVSRLIAIRTGIMRCDARGSPTGRAWWDTIRYALKEGLISDEAAKAAGLREEPKPNDTGSKAETDDKPGEISEEDLKELPRTFNPRLEVHLEDSNFITKYMVYGKTTSDAYEEFHFASGLVLLSVAADRQIVITMKHGDIYPNIWIFPIGDSTVSRKTTAHKLCKLILKNKYPKRSLPSSFSPEALMDAISQNPRCYYLKDEAGSLLSSLCKDYMAETRDFLAEIFECDDYYRKLKKHECNIRDPYITQYLMTTPDNLKEYTTPLDLTSGWLLRYLWMYPNYPKDWKPFAEKDESDFERFVTITGEYNLIVEKLATTRRLTMTEESMQFFQEWHRAIEETAMREADNITKALAGRLMTYAIKMAALFTIGRADFDENSKIELPHIQEAARLIVDYFLPIGRIIIDEVARAESKNTQDKIIGTIKRYNGRISQRDLLRVLHMKLKDVEEAIEALILSEEIEKQFVKTKKAKVLYYVMRECHSDIVSHNLVYKGKNKGSLYTPSCGTMTHRQMGQDGAEVVEDTPPASGPHPRKEDPEIARLRAGHTAHRLRQDKHTCSRCGKHDDVAYIMHDFKGYYCEPCRRGDGPQPEPIKPDAQIKLIEMAPAT